MLDVYFLFLLQIFHPVNYLRNVAIDNVLTKFVLYNDADFITNIGSHERIKAHIDEGDLKERQVGKFQILIVLGEGNFWFRFRLFIQFLPLWSMDEKSEAKPKIALAKYDQCIFLHLSI